MTAPGPHTLFAFARDAAGNISAAASAGVAEEANFIRAPQAVDMVYAAARDILYITSANSILRYQVASRTFLAPFLTDGTLSAIDLSPDGSTLAAADESRNAIFLVNLDSGTVVRKDFTGAGTETGMHSLAFGADGSLLVASKTGDGSASPLRRYDPATGEVKVIANLAAATLVSGAEAHCIAVGQISSFSNTSFGVYDVATQSIGRTTRPNVGNSEIGVSRDCGQLANAGSIFSNEALLQAVSFPSAVGVVYHPRADIVYLADGYTSNISAYETRTFSSIAAYDAGASFTGDAGHLRISPDGSLLFARVDQGITMIPLSAVFALGQNLFVNQGTPVPIQLAATTPQPDTLSYQIVTPPQHGTLTGTAPAVTYTSAPSFAGSDSFSFKAVNGHGEQGSATISITVAQDALAPVVTAFRLPASSAALVVPITEFTATDNAAVTGYCLTESNDSSSCAWSDSPPYSYDFSNTFHPYRPHTLFAFAKDAAGNISNPVSATVAVATSGTTPYTPSVSVPAISTSFTIWPTLQTTYDPGLQYCVTEKIDPLQCSTWSQYPGTYTFQGYGTHTLYLFAMNSSGKISAPATRTVTVLGHRGLEIATGYGSGNLKVVYEPSRQIVYLLQTGKILRYHLPSQTFLPPYLEGKSLAGLDLSPGGTTLVAGNAGSAGIYLIDLTTDTVTEVTFTREANELNSTGVAFGSDGAVLVTGAAANNGSAPMRRYHPVTGELKVVASISSGWNSSVLPSPGGKCISLYDGNGNVNVYDTGSQSITLTKNAWRAYYPNRDCTQFLAPSSSSYYTDYVAFYNGTLTSQNGQLSASAWGGRFLGFAYHPTKDIVYLLSGSNELKAYDSTTFAELASYPMKGALALPGQTVGSVPLAVSPDGNLLFAIYPDGVGYTRLTGAVAEDQSIAITEGAAVAVTLTGRSSRAATLGFRIVTPPSHGTLTGTPPKLFYTPEPGYLGADSFGFSVNDGTEESPAATLSIAIGSGQVPPATLFLDVPNQSTSQDVPVSFSIFHNGNSQPAKWCLSETGSAAHCSWSSSKPSHYVFSGSFPQGLPVTRTLYAFVTDTTGKIWQSSASSVAITMPDTTPPVVAGLSVPSVYPGLVVPFALVAGDNGNAMLYCVSETNSSSGCQWQWNYGNQLAKVTLGSYGSHTLYVFVRDNAGNVSAPSSATTLAVKPPKFTSLPTPSFIVGKSAQYAIAAEGYPTPSLAISGALPAGIALALNGNGTAALSGTPEPGTAGAYPITLTADIGLGFTASKQLTVTVAKDQQTLSFAPIPRKIPTDPPFSISVAASSGLPVTLTSSNPAVATVEGLTVTIHGEGATTITALQQGDGRYLPVSATQILNVRANKSLTVAVTGTGEGSVNSNPSGISCTGGTGSASFPYDTSVILLQTPSAGSRFVGWNGACSGTGACSVVMSSPQSVTATFELIPSVRIVGETQRYGVAQPAVDAASSGATIQAQRGALEGGVLLNQAKSVTLRGGYDASFTTQTGYTVLHGKLTILRGTLRVERVIAGN